jgi:predicted transcriptional regulator
MLTRFTVEEQTISTVLCYCMTLVAGTTFSLGVVVKLLLQLLQDSAHSTHTRNLVIVPVQLYVLLLVSMRFEVLATVLMTPVF